MVPLGDYMTGSAPPDAIQTITQSLGNGQTRVVSFTISGTHKSIATMTYTGAMAHTWTYTCASIAYDANWSKLTAVAPPVGPAWGFTYEEAASVKYELKELTTPNGGRIQYTFADQQFHIGTSYPVMSRALKYRDVVAVGEVPGGRWTYDYGQGSGGNQTVITSPSSCGSTTTTHTFIGVGTYTGGLPAWSVGLPSAKTVSDGVVGETESLVWIALDKISNSQQIVGPNVDPFTWVPLLQQRTVQRSGQSQNYVTTNTYHTGTTNFNDYGRPYLTEEVGQLSRTTERQFKYGFTPYIVDRLESETVTAAGQSYVKSYGYDLADGFKESETIYGIPTTFQPDTFGNVASVRDASDNTTSFTYSWGTLKNTTTPATAPAVTVERQINPEGTVAWAKRKVMGVLRQTSFYYDSLFRLTNASPAAGNATVTTYDPAGTYVAVTRGPNASGLTSSVTGSLDAFGRTYRTNNAVGVKTHVTWDACGRKTHESYPYTSADIGTDFEYDGLDRIKKRINTGDNPQTTVTYSYAGINVDVSDEQQRVTHQTWQAFGDPRDALLTAIQDAALKTTSYAYNGLGGLKEVTHPGSPQFQRTWAYYPNTPRVQTETHPESGAVGYAYWPNGLLKTRTDPGPLVTTYIYDGNHRLTTIDRPGALYAVTIDYDESDNRTSLANGYVSSSFGYDAASRLTSRTDRIGGQNFTTSYTPDGNDNIEDLTYPGPQGTKVAHEYDAENRISRVKNGITGGSYATNFDYHPSGAVLSYIAGNGLTHTVSYDGRYRVREVKTLNGASVFTASPNLTYTYYPVGNVEDITDQGTTGLSQHFVYDPVDRLTTVTGWSPGGFTYDEIGNRTTKTSGASTTYVYNGAPYQGRNLLTSATGAEPDQFGYDARGNLLSSAAGDYTHTPDNMMETATVGGVTTTYRYDGDNLRKKKESQGQRHYYVHGTGNQLLSELQAAAGGAIPVREYIYAGSRLLASVRPPALAVSPAQLTFAVVVGGPGGPNQTLTIDGGGSPLAWEASFPAGDTWLTVSPGSGTAPTSVTVGVNPAGLLVGTYTSTITITASAAINSPVEVTVRLQVVPNLGLVVQPADLAFVIADGDGEPLPQTLDILIAGGPPAPWQATAAAPWLAVSPPGGNTPFSAEVSVNPAGLTPGTYRSWITVTAPVDGSPKIVPVELVIQPGPWSDCAAEAWFCEPFNELALGPLDGQGGWQAQRPATAQVVPDPRGAGKVLLADPPAGETLSDLVTYPDQPIDDGLEVSVSLMTKDVPADSRQVAKLEFYTIPGVAWGHTRRTFGALRFGSKLYVQYGANIFQVLVDVVEPNRWYDVKVVYQNARVYAYVDGQLKFSTDNPLPPGNPAQAFVVTGWDFPGQAYLDLIQGRPLQQGLVVEPIPIRLRGTSAMDGSPQEVSRRTRLDQDYGRLPLSFEVNQGQTDASVRFMARLPGQRVFLTPEEVVLAASGARSNDDKSAALRMRFEGASPQALSGVDELRGKSNYLIGRDPKNWHTGVSRYAKVRYERLYPGVDLVLYGNQRNLEYDLVLAAGVDPSVIRLAFQGAEDVRIDDNGDLVLETGAGVVRQHKPLVYQERAGARVPVEGAYRVDGNCRVAFDIAQHDPGLPLFIDPVLSYSTYFGGSGYDSARAIAVDEDGAVYVAGGTDSLDFPTAGAIQTTNAGLADAFVAKLTPSGTGLEFSTYIGGIDTDSAASIAIDSLGRAYLAGNTSSATTFPTFNPIQPVLAGSQDAFVLRLSPDGASLEYSTYLGGGDFDEAKGIAVDPGNNAYIVGLTLSPDFPTVEPWQSNLAGGTDGFVAKIESDGTALAYSTYIGGSSGESANAVAVDQLGVSVAGVTSSADFPTLSAFQASLSGPSDAFVARLSLGGWPLYSTYLGGSGEDEARGIALGLPEIPISSPRVVGSTTSTDFPLAQGPPGGGADAFFAVLGSRFPLTLQESRYLGGEHNDEANAVAVDPQTGNAYVTGWTRSFDFPAVDPLQGYIGKYEDAFLSKISSGGMTLAYSTHLGGSGPDFGNAVAVDAVGAAYVAGETLSGGDFPIVNALQPDPGGQGDAFIAKIADVSAGPPAFEFVQAEFHFAEDHVPAVGVPPSAVITVRRNGPVVDTATVDFETADGTATSPQDYTATSGTLTFGPGERERSFLVPLVDDGIPEGSETVSLQLLNPSAGVSLGQQAAATLFIEDVDGLTRQFTIRDRVRPVGPQWSINPATIPSWLTLDATTGQAPSVVTATGNAFNPPGTYQGFFTLTGDPGDEQAVEVIMILDP